MTRVIYGERIGREAAIRVGASAAILSPGRDKILLTRRADNGQWCLPAGGMEPGESIVEACEREVREETGLIVRVGRLIGVYTSPDVIIEYPGRGRFQIAGLHFQAEVVGGALATSDETTDLAFFSPAEIEGLDVMEHHRERIADAFHVRAETIVR